MLKRLLVAISLLVIVPAFQSYSADIDDKVRGPIVVTSDRLTADSKANTALFDSNVVARTDEMVLYADRMLVYYEKNSGDVTTIEATGNVKLRKDDKLITAEKAVYYAGEEKVVFSGNTHALDGENVVTGTKMTFFLRDDRSFVENSKVILKR
jgi:lipopolysaccharide export system protein LptA